MIKYNNNNPKDRVELRNKKIKKILKWMLILLFLFTLIAYLGNKFYNSDSKYENNRISSTEVNETSEINEMTEMILPVSESKTEFNSETTSIIESNEESTLDTQLEQKISIEDQAKVFFGDKIQYIFNESVTSTDIPDPHNEHIIILNDMNVPQAYIRVQKNMASTEDIELISEIKVKANLLAELFENEQDSVGIGYIEDNQMILVELTQKNHIIIE